MTILIDQTNDQVTDTVVQSRKIPKAVLKDITNLLESSRKPSDLTSSDHEQKSENYSDRPAFSETIYGTNPFDKKFRNSPRDSVFGQRTPCGKDIVPVTVARIQNAYKDNGGSLNAIEYFMAIQRRCVEREEEFMVNVNFLTSQTQIKVRDRKQVITWMVDAQKDMQLSKNTLFLAVNIFYRCLNIANVERKHLNEIGVTSLWIAHKFEELVPPHGECYETYCDNVVTRDDILRTELEILEVIEYELVVPTTHTFLMKLLDLVKILYGINNSTMIKTAHRLTTFTLMSLEMLQYRPSKIAAAAIRLSAELSDVELFWNDTMEYYSGGWSVFDIMACQVELRQLWNAKNCSDSKNCHLRVTQKK